MAGMSLIDEVLARRLPAIRARRAIRLSASVPQVRMAAELGVHRSTFIRWENGIQEPRGDSAERYARLLAELQRIAA
ncbi:MAG: helix-turn-helix domain-containing protein [Streptosporangiaceae bacterium]